VDDRRPSDEDLLEPVTVDATTDPLGMIEGRPALVSYDDRWPGLFMELRTTLLRELGRRVISVHHVGSTSVPGLAAKPVLDVLVAVADLDRALECVPVLEGLGFEYGPEDDIPERHWFRGRNRGLRTHHLSIAESDSSYFRDHLAFRDALRCSPDLAVEYEQLKSELLAQHTTGRPLHGGKTAFVTGVLNSVGRSVPSTASANKK